jgi:hypothetical protein
LHGTGGAGNVAQVRNALSAAVLGAALLLAGCKSSGELRVDVICAGLCPCMDPDERDECFAQCPQQIPPSEISDQCLECFVESDSCFEVTEICLRICSETDPDAPDGESTDAPVPLPL